PRWLRHRSCSHSAPTPRPASATGTRIPRNFRAARVRSGAVDLRGWGGGATSVTDDVEAPTVVDTPTGAAPPPSGNGSGGRDGSGPGDGNAGAASGDGAPARAPKRSSKRAFVEWAVLIVVAIVIAIVIKTFLFQAFYIPSESIVPTARVGERVLGGKRR